MRKRHHQINKPAILDHALDLRAQDLPVDPIKELADIQLQSVAVSGACPQSVLCVLRRFMGALALTARKRLIDKRLIEQRINQPVDCMLNDSVAERWREDLAWLWFVHHKAVVRFHSVAAVMQLLVELVQIRAQALLKIKAGTGRPLTLPGVQVRQVQRLRRKCLLKQMPVSLHCA